MSDDTQQPIPEIETQLPLEPVAASAVIADVEHVFNVLSTEEHVENVPQDTSEVIEQGRLDDASENFADEAADDEADGDSDDDSAPYEYDGAVDEEFDPPPKRERETAYGKKKDKKKSLVGDADLLDSDEFDGDNDPSPGARLKKHEHSGPAKFAPQRLAKILAAAGIDARRKCEEFVTTGRVTVDGKVKIGRASCRERV